MEKQLIIIGASGHGKVVADVALKMGQWNRIAFLDDDETLTSCLGLPVIGKTADATTLSNADFFIAIGNNSTRKTIQEKFLTQNLSIATLIHPSAVIGNEVHIGVGTLVAAGAVINSGTSIGNACIINTSSSIDHDNTIGDYVHISPGAHLAGSVSVGNECWLGIGSIVSNNVSICHDCILGAAAVVVKDIYEPGIYVGVPVRRLVK